jgi:O-succinylhomoserine sulfhydrylase
MAIDNTPPTPKTTRRRVQTELVHGGTLRSEFGETSEAMFLTSGFSYETAEQAEARFTGDEEGFIYSRYSNPTVRMFETRMALLEGAEDARSTASGMAAVTAAILCQVKAGDHIVAAKALFGACLYVVNKLLPDLGVECTLVDGRDLDAWKAARQPNTRVFFLESPTNPTLELVDISAVAEIAHECGARLVVDNVFATPILQKPLELGADVVVYSATKHIDGQGRVLGGIILSDQQFIDEYVHDFLRQTGLSLSPFNAWVLLKGLETLSLRVKQHCENAKDIADFLATRPQVKRSIYPHRPDHPQYQLALKQMSAGSTMVAIELDGGKAEAFAVCNAVKLFKISNNLGDAKSIITHPTTTTHQRIGEEARQELGITPGVLRFSIGLEDVEDLKDDLAQALKSY